MFPQLKMFVENDQPRNMSTLLTTDRQTDRDTQTYRDRDRDIDRYKRETYTEICL